MQTTFVEFLEASPVSLRFFEAWGFATVQLKGNSRNSRNSRKRVGERWVQVDFVRVKKAQTVQLF